MSTTGSFECQGCHENLTTAEEVADHKQRHGLVINLEPFSLAMSPAEAKEWHNSRGIPWGSPFEGPHPKTVSRMQHPDRMNLSVHLSNEHNRNSDYIEVKRLGQELSHMVYHLYGIFRKGQEHYHEQP